MSTEIMIEKMTREEKSLILFFEYASVDGWGKFNMAHLDDDDRAIMKRWNESGFVASGRIASHDIAEPKKNAFWCELTDEAASIAATIRRERAKRTWANRKWQTTKEKQE